MKSVIAWFADNHVAANLLMFFLLLAGAVTGLTMKVEVFPESSLDQIAITVTYSGASPLEIEEGIVRPIEEKVAGLAGVKRIDATAREGFASVIVEVMKDWDRKMLLDEVKAEVDRITTFPEEAETPVVQEMTRRMQVISLAVYGDVGDASLKKAAQQVKDDLINLPEITLAEVAGVRDNEIHIEVSESTLRQYGMTLGQLAAAVRQASLDLPGGSVKTASGEILIRTKGRRNYADDYADIPVITRPDGTRVLLGQVAEIREAFEDVDLFARFNGKPAALVRVYRVADQNALTVAATVKEWLVSAPNTLPQGVGIEPYSDTSRVLKGRISLLLKNMAIGLILVVVLLGVFLDLKLAFWVTLGIPVSFLAGLWVLPRFDISINMISLFAFIAVLGIVVDDAIVIGENIYRKKEEGLPPLAAAVEGSTEVGRPVIFSVLTTVAAFWPLLYGGGMLGKVMYSMPVVVIAVLLGSLLESLLILPAHLRRSRQGANAAVPMKQKRVSRWLNRMVEGPYQRTVRFCIRWRYATIGAGVAAVFLTVGLYLGGFVQFTFFPKVDGDIMTCTLSLPPGTAVEETVRIVQRIEDAGRQALEEADRTRPSDAEPLFEHSVAVVGIHSGGQGPHGGRPEIGGHLAEVFVQVLDGEKRNISTSKLARMWRKKVGRIPEADAVTFDSSHFSAGNAVEVHLSHSDHQTLQAAVEVLKKELSNLSGVTDIGDSFAEGKSELQLRLTSAAAELGLSVDDLASQVRHAFYGARVLRFQRNLDEVTVLVRYPEKERKSLSNIENMFIRTPDGRGLPFSQVADADLAPGYAAIQHAQRYRVIKVTADVDNRTANANDIRTELIAHILPQLSRRFPGLRFVMEGEGKEQQESLADVGRNFVIALFVIYALLAVPFRSFTQPLVVMAAIPFGIVGAVAGHFFMGFDISLVSLFGIVGLSGVVVNDSLVLIHAANRIRSEGVDAGEAVARAGALRFRAIMLTSLTTFAGITPMLLEKSFQAQMLIPMAISLGFGVLFATVITLLLIPCGYVVREDIERLFSSGKSPDVSRHVSTDPATN